jgi:hypothetical protein
VIFDKSFLKSLLIGEYNKISSFWFTDASFATMVRESVIIFEFSDGSIEDEDTIVEKVNNLVSEVSMEEENID